MLYLEYRLDQEAFRVAVVPAKRQDFADNAAALLPLDMDDKIDGFSDLRFGIGEGGLRVATHDQIGEAREGFRGRVGMNCRQRSGVASVEGIEQRSRLASAHFAENDSVGSPAESVTFKKLVERHIGLESIGLASGGNNVRLLNLKLRGVLDDDKALLVWNEVGQYSQKRRLSGPRAAADEQRLSAANLLG